MKSLDTNRLVVGTVTIVLIALLLTTLDLYKDNDELKRSNDQERLKTERLLSEKLLLDKEIAEFKSEMARLKGKNNQIDILLKSANQSLAEQESRTEQLSKESRSAKMLKKQLGEIRRIRENLRSEIENLTISNQDLQVKNLELRKKIDLLIEENRQLAEELNNKSLAGNSF